MTDQTQPVTVGDLIAQGLVTKPPLELDQKLKEEWGRREDEVTLERVEFLYDPEGRGYFNLTATVGEQKVLFRLGANGKRDQFLQDLEKAVASSPIRGLRLHTYDGGSGNPRVELEPI